MVGTKHLLTRMNTLKAYMLNQTKLMEIYFFKVSDFKSFT